MNRGVKRMGTGIVIAILVAAVALVVRKLVKDKKAGKSIQCGGDCNYCSHGCGGRS